MTKLPTLSRAERKQLEPAREEAALEEIASLGGLVTLYEPRQGDMAGTCTICLTSTSGKAKLFNGVSAIHCLDMLRLFVRRQERLAPDAAGRWDIASTPTAVQVIHRTPSNRQSRERRVETVVRAAANTPPDAYRARGDV